MTKRAMTSFLGPVLLFAACSGDSYGTAPVTKPASPAVAALTLTKRPDDVLAVVAAKQKGPNNALAVTGRVASVVPGRAAFTLMDLALPYCGETNKGDTCKTPWDYCCETPESKKANLMTVQFVDKDGKPLKVGAQGVEGLEPLALVVFEGTVAEVDDKGNFVVRVTKMFVEKPAKK